MMHMAPLCSYSTVTSSTFTPQRSAQYQRSVTHLSASTASSSPGTSTGTAGLSLKRWQRERLGAAFAKGKRHVSIKELSSNTQLDRADVLRYFKDLEKLPPGTLESLVQPRQAGPAATEEREAVFAAAAAEPRRSKPARERLHYQPGYEPHGLRSAPWAANFGRKKMPRSVEATLERIFEASPRPSDAVVAGLWDLHRLPKKRVLDWFAQRRRAAQGQE